MQQTRTFFLILATTALNQLTAESQHSQTPRIVDIKTPDGTVLKASYFAAAKPGPGVLLFHQSNRTRTSWDDVAKQLAAAGINTLTVDVRGRARKERWPADLDAAFQFLVSQPGVTRDLIGIGGAGALGVDNSVETARRHRGEVKALVLMSGETLRPQLQFLHQASQLPELFVVSDDDEYPPTQRAIATALRDRVEPKQKTHSLLGGPRRTVEMVRAVRHWKGSRNRRPRHGFV